MQIQNNQKHLNVTKNYIRERERENSEKWKVRDRETQTDEQNWRFSISIIIWDSLLKMNILQDIFEFMSAQLLLYILLT